MPAVAPKMPRERLVGLAGEPSAVLSQPAAGGAAPPGPRRMGVGGFFVFFWADGSFFGVGC